MKTSLFKEKGRKPPIPKREEKLAIYVIRCQQRPLIEAELQEELGYKPNSEIVEKILDLLIQESKDTGELQEVVDEYLALKIAEERARGGAPSKSQ